MVLYVALDLYGTKPMTNARVGIFYICFTVYNILRSSVIKQETILKVAWTGLWEKTVVNDAKLVHVRMAPIVSPYVTVVMMSVTMYMDANVYY